jgi:1-acyl-sn-glycerol-3-phosphate acyltransferase
MSRSYRSAMQLLRLLVRLFFRRVEVEGTEHVPQARGGLLVAWHPNGLIDPGLVLAKFPGRVVFGARHGLFAWPLLGWLMRSIGTVPIYRAVDVKGDAAGRRGANRKSLDALAQRVADGSFAALFPEGVSHDAPHLMELKTGAARLYYRVRQLQAADEPPPAIIPVGLHYDQKRAFRSSALVRFHPALGLPPELCVRPEEEDDEAIRSRARELTDRIEEALEQVVHPTASWELHHLIHRARKLVRAERAHRAGADPGRPKLLEKQLGFARIWGGYHDRLRTHPAEVDAVAARVREYDADLRALRLEDHELDRNPRLASPWLALIVLAQIVTVYVLLPPLLVIGYVVNLPAALLVLAVCKGMSQAKKDEASLKLLAGAVLFPLAWIVAGVLAALGHIRLHAWFPTLPDTPVLAGVVTALLGAVGGAVAVRYGRLSRETLRAMRVRLRRRRRQQEVARLRLERSDLHDRLIRLAEGLDLPGEITRDGRVVPR